MHKVDTHETREMPLSIGDILANIVFLTEKYFLKAEKGQIGPSILKSLMSIPLRKGSVFDSFNLKMT
jgi:hypothetical protein